MDFRIESKGEGFSKDFGFRVVLWGAEGVFSRRLLKVFWRFIGAVCRVLQFREGFRVWGLEISDGL